MFRINDRDIKNLENDLKTFANKAVPFATRKTLNDAAFATQKIARADMQDGLVLRNKFTVQSIQVEQARTLNVRRQASVIGSTADYMETQEFGGVKSKNGSEGVRIATSYSAGQSENSRPRMRLPRKPNKIQNIKLTKGRRRGTGLKQRNLIAIKQASETGRKYVFLDLNKRKGIFKVVGGKRKPKIKMIHDMTKPSVAIPKRPWLAPSYNEAARMLPAFYADALRFQLRRRGLFDRR